jgi:prolyl-tRNA synthetase
MKVVIDDSIVSSPNLVAGANEIDYHLLNTNTPRDYQADLVADLAAAEEGNLCPDCGQPIRTARGVEIGNIFQLGTRYSDAFSCTYLDKEGQPRPVVMGSYGIGVGRLLACIAEEYHDDHGLTWPVTVAPYPIHLVLLRGKGSPQAEQTAEKLYSDLQIAGLSVLYDDRDESPGVKFNDADLIGLPLRLTVSERALAQGGVECKLRTESEKTILQLNEVVTRSKEILQDLERAILSHVVSVQYNG